MIDTIFRDNTKLSAAGAWISPGYNSKGKEMRIRIGSTDSDNPKYQNMIEKSTRAYRHFKSVPDDVVHKTMAKAISETVIYEWENIEDNGAIVKYAKKNVYDMLLKYPKFLHWIIQQSERDDLFNDVSLEDDVKN